MAYEVRRLVPADVDHVVAFGMRAWAPVSASFEHVLGPDIYGRVYPDWAASQAEAIRTVCLDPDMHVWVAADGVQLVGFVAVVYHDDPRCGEIEMIAVDPDHQRQGVASTLTAFAVEQIRSAGVDLATVATGGDPGHAPARHTYEKAGFTPLPLVRYYKAL